MDGGFSEREGVCAWVEKRRRRRGWLKITQLIAVVCCFWWQSGGQPLWRRRRFANGARALLLRPDRPWPGTCTGERLYSADAGSGGAGEVIGWGRWRRGWDGREPCR